MRSWFEFGYNGFPSGEARKRFFRQRDDPCGSEEDNDYDDETNDRPIYYYPLRRSEEATSTSSANGVPSDEDEEAAADHGPVSTLPVYTDTTAHENAVAWCGASVVELTGHISSSDRSEAEGVGNSSGVGAMEAEESSAAETTRYVLWHGGAPLAQRHVATGCFTLARLLPRPVRPTTHGTTLPAARIGPVVHHQVDYVPVPYDTSLESVLSSPLSHPVLRACLAPALHHSTPRARYGHCAAPVVLPPQLARTLLIEGLANATRNAVGRVESPSVGSFLAPSMPQKKDYELHLSFIIGGAEQVPSATSAASPAPVSASNSTWGVNDSGSGDNSHHSHRSHRGMEHHEGSHSSPSHLHSRHGGQERSVGTVLSPIRSVTMSKPSLCFTLVRRPGSRAGTAHWTRCFELGGDSRLQLEPRMFATLTPWPNMATCIEGKDGMDRHPRTVGQHVISFAYCGGTETGIDPLPLFALTRIQLDYESWQWSARVEPTLGAEPCARFGHTASYWDACLLVFGGVGRGRSFLNDLHILNTHSMVWREVFAPLNVGLPPRAFHCASVLLQQHQQQPSGPTHSERCYARSEAAKDSFQPLEQSNAISSALTPHRTGGRLAVLGGEGEAGMEPSVWVCELDTGAWQPCSFPLLSQLPSYHVARRATATEIESNAVGELTPSRLQQTVRGLVEKGLDQHRVSQRDSGRSGGGCSSGPACPYPPAGHHPSLASAHAARRQPVETAFFFSTMHGSLACAIPLPPNVGGGVLVMGGTCSPPVLFVTHLVAPEGSLKELAAFWLFSTPHSLPARVLRRAPAYFSRMLRGSRFDTYVTAAVSHDGTNAASGRGDAGIGRSSSLSSSLSLSATARAPSSGPALPSALIVAMPANEETPQAKAMAETQRLVGLGALDEQMSQWVRSARRRLRAGSYA